MDGENNNICLLDNNFLETLVLFHVVKDQIEKATTSDPRVSFVEFTKALLK